MSIRASQRQGCNQWRTSMRSHDVRPANAIGASITPDATAHTKGAWAEVFDGALWTTYGAEGDAYELWVHFNSGFTSTASRLLLADIGISPLDNGSYTTLIENLQASNARSSQVTSKGIAYRFRIRIPGGASLACRAQAGGASDAGLRCEMQLLADPTRPDLIAYGSRVITYGANVGTTKGVILSGFGQVSEGSWEAVATALSEPVLEWNLGFTVVDATLTGGTYSLDVGIGDATHKVLAVDGFQTETGTNELHAYGPVTSLWGGAVGDNAYIRGQYSSNPLDDEPTAILYATV